MRRFFIKPSVPSCDSFRMNRSTAAAAAAAAAADQRSSVNISNKELSFSPSFFSACTSVCRYVRSRVSSSANLSVRQFVWSSRPLSIRFRPLTYPLPASMQRKKSRSQHHHIKRDPHCEVNDAENDAGEDIENGNEYKGGRGGSSSDERRRRRRRGRRQCRR